MGHVDREVEWYEGNTRHSTRRQRNKRAHIVHGNTAQTEDAEMHAEDGSPHTTDGPQPTNTQQPTTRRDQHDTQAPQRQFQGNRTWIPVKQPKGKSTKCRICGKIFHEGDVRAKNPNTGGHYRCTTCIPKNHNMAKETTSPPNNREQGTHNQTTEHTPHHTRAPHPDNLTRLPPNLA
eukprot:6955672-Prorocentrum_lima.AAC.1